MSARTDTETLASFCESLMPDAKFLKLSEAAARLRELQAEVDRLEAILSAKDICLACGKTEASRFCTCGERAEVPK